MRTIRVFLAAVIAAFAAPLVAQDSADTIPVEGGEADGMDAVAGALPYNFAQVHLQHTKLDESDVDQIGIVLDGSFQLTEQFLVVGSVTVQETDEFDTVFGPSKIESTLVTVGGGYRHAIADGTDLSAFAQFALADVKVAGFSDDDSGYMVTVAARHQVTADIEARLAVDYLDIFDGDGTSVGLSGLYQIIPALAAGAEFVFSEGDQTFGLIGRYSF